MKSAYRTVGWLTLFGLAMGYLECTVVVYLREIYYPGGFRFPLVMMDGRSMLIEIGREAATMVMLACAGIVAGRNATQRFAWFIYIFGIWDIAYYVFLKLLLNWPQGLLTWDILFLIPVPWVGPVLAPCLISCTMIVLALVIIQKGDDVRLSSREWGLLIVGAAITVVACCRDFIRPGASLSNTSVIHYIPQHFPWYIFVPGLALIWVGLLSILLEKR